MGSSQISQRSCVSSSTKSFLSPLTSMRAQPKLLTASRWQQSQMKVAFVAMPSIISFQRRARYHGRCLRIRVQDYFHDVERRRVAAIESELLIHDRATEVHSCLVRPTTELHFQLCHRQQRRNAF